MIKILSMTEKLGMGIFLVPFCQLKLLTLKENWTLLVSSTVLLLVNAATWDLLPRVSNLPSFVAVVVVTDSVCPFCKNCFTCCCLKC